MRGQTYTTKGMYQCSICGASGLTYVCSFAEVEACSRCITELENTVAEVVQRMKDKASLDKVAGCCQGDARQPKELSKAHWA
jgi:hypothetical protein